LSFPNELSILSSGWKIFLYRSDIFESIGENSFDLVLNPQFPESVEAAKGHSYFSDSFGTCKSAKASPRVGITSIVVAVSVLISLFFL